MSSYQEQMVQKRSPAAFQRLFSSIKCHSFLTWPSEQGRLVSFSSAAMRLTRTSTRAPSSKPVRSPLSTPVESPLPSSTTQLECHRHPMTPSLHNNHPPPLLRRIKRHQRRQGKIRSLALMSKHRLSSNEHHPSQLRKTGQRLARRLPTQPSYLTWRRQTNQWSSMHRNSSMCQTTFCR